MVWPAADRGVRVAAFAAALFVVATPVQAAEKLADFARCITRKGASMYSASWCPNCRRQLEMFGDAADDLDVIECSLQGSGFRTPQCEDAEIRSYPTWEFRDGSRQSGMMSLSRLSQKTGCALPAR